MYNLLIVDDERLERLALKMYFDKSVGACSFCDEARDGKQALQLMEENAYDIVLMDIRMPGDDGLTIAKEVKTKHPEVAVIMLTAYAEFEYAQRAVKLHADDYLLKPSRPELIAGTIGNVLMKRKNSNSSTKYSSQAELFTKKLISAKYYESVLAFDAYLDSRSEHLERQKEDIKLILEGILRLVDRYDLDMSDENIDWIKNIKNFYHDKQALRAHVHDALNDLFYEIVEKKLCRHAREIDYALDYIEFNLKRKLSLDQIAKYMSISPQYFSRYFKQEIGKTFVNYLSERRVEYAKKEIEYTNKSFGDISFELCFNEANYFSKVFRKQTDMTPSEYKESISIKVSNSDSSGQNQYVVSKSWMI